MPVQQSVNLHASRSNEVLIPAILCPALAALAVLLRLYTRCILLKSPAWDDLFVVLALAFSIGNSVAQGLEAKDGFGKHVATLTPPQIVACLQALFASILLYNLSLTCIKLSIIQLYLRVFAGRTSRRICQALFAIMVAYGLEATILGIFSCTPIAFFWNSKIKGGTCVDKTTVYYANAGISIVTDLALLFIPVVFLWNLAIPKLQKALIMLIVAFGGLSCIASILRLRTLYTSTKSKDATWDKVPTIYWSTIEINVGIICASLSTLWSFGSRMFPRTFRFEQQERTSVIVDAAIARAGDLENSEKAASGSLQFVDSNPGKMLD